MEGIVLRRPPHRHGRRQIRYHEKECTAYRTLNTKKTMLTYELEKLIKSLSASEKKHFQLHCTKLKSPKDYLLLYNLVIDSNNGKSWEQQFRDRKSTRMNSSN